MIKTRTEVFEISDLLPRSPPVYKLKDDDEPLEGSFYKEELQRVKTDGDRTYYVEKVLKRRTVGGEKQVLVRWRNWPPKFDSWIKASDLKKLENEGFTLSPSSFLRCLPVATNVVKLSGGNSVVKLRLESFGGNLATVLTQSQIFNKCFFFSE